MGAACRGDEVFFVFNFLSRLELPPEIKGKLNDLELKGRSFFTTTIYNILKQHSYN